MLFCSVEDVCIQTQAKPLDWGPEAPAWPHPGWRHHVLTQRVAPPTIALAPRFPTPVAYKDPGVSALEGNSEIIWMKVGPPQKLGAQTTP